MGILLFLVFSYKFLVSVPRFLSVKFEGCKKRLIMDCPILTWNCLEIYWARKNGVDALMDQRVNLSACQSVHCLTNRPVSPSVSLTKVLHPVLDARARHCICSNLFVSLIFVCSCFRSVGWWMRLGIGKNITLMSCCSSFKFATNCNHASPFLAIP